MDLVNLSIIFVVAIIGASFGTLVGGTSLITIPVLIFLGLPPHAAIGTDRLGITGLASVGWYKFHEKGLIHYPIALIVGVGALVGSFFGANLVLQISTGLLKKIIAIATIFLLILVIVQPRLGVEKKERTIKRHRYGVGVFISFIVGIYGLVLNVMAVKAVHQFDWGRSIASSAVIWVGLLCCASVVIIVILTLMGPAIGNVFSGILNDLATPTPSWQ